MQTAPPHTRPALPQLPWLLSRAAAPLPLAPVSAMLSALTRKLVQAHPAMLRRLGPHADRRVLIDPTDLPFALLMQPRTAQVRACRRNRLPAHDARIAGPLSAFLAMLHGAEDGDALFFSRDLTIEGDTEAVLALRNAIDDAELDLTETIATAAGPLGPGLRRALARAERISGLALHRMETTGDWP